MINNVRDLKLRLYDHHRNLPSYLTVLPTVVACLHRESALGIIYIDGRELRGIEERLGSSVFEDIMVNLSRILSNMRGTIIRRGDILTVSQVKGYSFIIFLNETRDDRKPRFLSKDAVEKTCERVQNYLHTTLFFELYSYLKGLPKINVGYSFAVHNPMIDPWRAIYNLIEEARKMADLQMSQVEMRNRGRIQKIILESELNIVYQPIVDLGHMHVMGYESLTRGPVHTELEAPVILFKLAEETGLLFELDRLCRRLAVTHAGKMQKGMKLFINTLPNLVYQPDLEAKQFVRILEQHHIPLTDVVLEITERNAVEHFSDFRQALRYYTSAGISIAIDDVGAGYSSLEAIMEINPKYIKIDAAIIRGAATSKGKQAMLQALHTLSSSIGASTVAEGIETLDDLYTVKKLAIDFGQGYLFARPSATFEGIAPISSSL